VLEFVRGEYEKKFENHCARLFTSTLHRMTNRNCLKSRIFRTHEALNHVCIHYVPININNSNNLEHQTETVCHCPNKVNFFIMCCFTLR